MTVEPYLGRVTLACFLLILSDGQITSALRFVQRGQQQSAPSQTPIAGCLTNAYLHEVSSRTGSNADSVLEACHFHHSRLSEDPSLHFSRSVNGLHDRSSERDGRGCTVHAICFVELIINVCLSRFLLLELHRFELHPL